MRSNKGNLLLALILVIGAGLACNLGSEDTKGTGETSEKSNQTEQLPRKLDAYEIKGFKFAYYLIPADLDREALIKTANEIHAEDTDSQLILVDDDSKVAEYIKYAKAISGIGELDEPMPQEWADKHIIANVQKYTSGRWVLCESNGSVEIADLKE